MLFLPQKIKAAWNNKNKKHFVDLGFNFTKTGDSFFVDVTHLTKNSKFKVKVSCDYCGQDIYKAFQTYNKQHSELFGDCCKNCQPRKNKLVCLHKYGTDNVSKTLETKNKIKETFISKYNVDNISKKPEIKEKLRYLSKKNALTASEKRKETVLKKYGVENVFQNKAIQDKIKVSLLNTYGVTHPKKSKTIIEKEKQNNLIKYGVENYAQTEECKQKIKNTCLEKYGYESTLLVPEIRAKAWKTLLSQGKTLTSKPQLKLYELLKDMYGNCELNFQCEHYFLDCMIEVKGVKIDIEYDGEFWHQDKNRDDKRDVFVKKQGYKILRIKGRKNIPEKEKIKEAINLLVNTDKNSFYINMI